MKKVTIIGLGYVGLPLALLAADKGYDVTGIDLDEAKIDLINKRQDPIGEPYIKEKLKNTTLKAATGPAAIAKSDIIIICVPTPVNDDYQPDLGPVRGAVTTTAKHIKKGAILILESTINPGVSEEVVIPLLEKESGLKANRDVFVSHCPERINPGDPKWNVTNIPRVVGSSNAAGLKQTAEFYESIIDAPIKRMGSLKEAEACKVVENSFRDVNIAFVNELAKSFTKLGINVKNVIEGASTKPFAFMAHYPSLGVGGHCIPVDPYYLIEYARDNGFEHEFLALARSINNSMPAFAVEQLNEVLNEKGLPLKGLKVTVLGVSYKANVGDDRESPSYKLIRILKAKKAKVVVYDPYFPKKSDVKNMAAALKGAEAVVLAANHSEFLEYDYKKVPIKVFMDGKNALSPKKLHPATVYRGIGTR
jgi:nucleotide sugar dehydrogenase